MGSAVLLRAPVLVFAVGNSARGDDGLGPLLAERLEAWRVGKALGELEVLTDFQLNIEHVLDLQGRQRVLIIDASASGTSEFSCMPVLPADDASYSTHAVSPAGLLQVFRQVLGQRPPPLELLAIRAESFALGAPLSAAAAQRCEAAWCYLQQWCDEAVQAALRPLEADRA